MDTCKKVLIIDNDIALYEAFLKKFPDSIDSLVVSSSEAGITKTTQWMPNLIILEIMIPGHHNGFDVLHQLKANSKTKDIPVIVYTGLKGERKTAMENGALDYLVKPNIDPDNIAERVSRYFKNIAPII